jgi:polyisoprenoid-binding protein YceI
MRKEESSMGHSFSIRNRLLASGLTAALLLLIAISTSAHSPAMAQDLYPDEPATPTETESATPGTAESATPATADCNVDEAVASAPTVYSVNGEESTANYIAQQELASIGAQEVVGTTNAIIGSILFDEDGKPLECSNFAVDMRTLVSDESMRDNYLRGNTLESDTFPFATFVVSSVEGLEDGLVEGEPVTAQLTGDLSLHGVTRPATWEAEFTATDGTITGTATTTFVIADYEMEKPIVGPVLSIEDEIELQVEITATSEA